MLVVDSLVVAHRRYGLVHLTAMAGNNHDVWHATRPSGDPINMVPNLDCAKLEPCQGKYLGTATGFKFFAQSLSALCSVTRADLPAEPI
jgi:hypothetical protein